MSTEAKNETLQLTLEDLSVGQRFRSGSHQLNAEEIVSFAQEFDPQPFHINEQAAKETMFAGLAASGWHTASITMSLVVASVPVKGGIVGAGAEVSWPRPTRPGDTLHVESEVIEIVPSRSRPDRGMVTVRSTTINQNGETVQILVSKLVVPKG